MKAKKITANKPKRVSGLAEANVDAGHMEAAFHSLRQELRAAIERKPNEVLNRLVYQLGATRVELAAVQEQLSELVSLMKQAPTLQPSSGFCKHGTPAHFSCGDCIAESAERARGLTRQQA